MWQTNEDQHYLNQTANVRDVRRCGRKNEEGKPCPLILWDFFGGIL